MKIINGRGLARQILKGMKEKIIASGLTPGLGVVLVGDDPASHLYVSLKEKACAEVGIHFEKYLFFATEPEEKILNKIRELNQRKDIHGILVQLPLPSPLKADRVIAAIAPQKDVDGFHPENVKRLFAGQPRVEPVLGKAVWVLIKETSKHLNIKTFKHLNTLVIGNSEIFLKISSAYLRLKGLNIIQTSLAENIQYSIFNIRQFDIIVVAVGQPNFLTGNDFKDGAIVIDIGINHLPDGKIVGDVNYESTQQKNGWITPVPGGVGPVTVAMLLENVYELSRKYELTG